LPRKHIDVASTHTKLHHFDTVIFITFAKTRSKINRKRGAAPTKPGEGAVGISIIEQADETWVAPCRTAIAPGNWLANQFNWFRILSISQDQNTICTPTRLAFYGGFQHDQTSMLFSSS